MATEEQKSIEISYKADLKDLISKLKQMPNITEAEAKKMVAALDRQIKQAETAAKKSAEATKTAAQAARKAAQDSARSFNDLSNSADTAAKKLEHVAEKSGDIDRGFSGMEIALRGVNPQLGEAAAGLADTFAVVESLIMGFGALNPIVLVGAAAIGALTLGYTAYANEVEEAKQNAEKMKQRITELNEVIEDQADIIKNTNIQLGSYISTLNDSANQLAILRGDMTDYDLATAQATQTAENFRMEQEAIQKTQTKAIETSISARKEEIYLLKQQIGQLETQRKLDQSSAERWAGKGPKYEAMTFEEQQLRNTLASMEKGLQKDQQRLQVAKDQRYAIEAQAAELEKNLIAVENIKESERKRAELQKQREEAQKRQEELARKAAQEAEIEAKALEDALNIVSERYDIEVAKMNAKKTLQDIINRGQQTEIDKIQEKYEKEFETLELFGLQSKDQEAVYQAAMALRKQALQEIHELETAQIAERKKMYMDMGGQLVNAVDAFATASMDFLKNTGLATEENTKKLFKLQQAAAVADIAMQTAVNITKAGGNPFMIAAMAAVGVAQTAAVLSQKPPTLHMGGMAPDEANAKVLRGEAVIDRTTVRSLGGEVGIRQLQNNGAQNTPNVVILSPYKHIDRYNRSARKMMGRKMIGAY